VALFSETHLKPHERFYIQNYHFYRNDRQPGKKGRTAVAVKKGIPHSHVDLPPLISVEATGVCIPIGNRKILLAAVYKSPGRTWSDASHLPKLQHLQNKVLRTIGNFPRRTSVRDMHVAFQIPYVYGYITKSCRNQAEVIQNNENENVRNIGQGEAPHRKYRRLKLGGGHVYDC
jgi:hypothetical protein